MKKVELRVGALKQNKFEAWIDEFGNFHYLVWHLPTNVCIFHTVQEDEFFRFGIKQFGNKETAKMIRETLKLVIEEEKNDKISISFEEKDWNKIMDALQTAMTEYQMKREYKNLDSIKEIQEIMKKELQKRGIE